MASANARMRSVSATVPSDTDLYVPPERLRSGAHEEMVWVVMRLCISKPGAVWCTACKAWYKYHPGSMPSLVRHCTKFHKNNGATRSAQSRQPPSGSSGTVAPNGQHMPPSFDARMKPKPAVAIAPPSHTSPGPSTVHLTKPGLAQASSGGRLNAAVTKSSSPATAVKTVAVKTSSVATPSAAPHIMQTKVSPPTSGNVAPNSAPPAPSAGAAVDQKPAKSIPVASKGISKQRNVDRVVKVIAIPDAVRNVAERCQSLLFDSTGMTFFNVKFQVPRSKEEALSVIRGGIRDMEKQDTTQKLYFLGWAHSQFFSAEMAALGYRFSTASIRCDKKMTKPPPVEEWLTLELSIRVRTRSRKKVLQSPADKASNPSEVQKTLPVNVHKVEQTATEQTAAAPAAETKSASMITQSAAQAAMQLSTKAQGNAVISFQTPQKPKGRIVDTIDLT